MKAIIHAKLIMEDGIIWDGAVTFENGLIVSVGPCDKVTIPEGTEILDAKGLYVSPGLIDIHNHACPDYLFWENPEKCSEFFLVHGETTICPTLYQDMTADQMLEGAKRIREASKSGAGRVMDGLYMEGPYMCRTSKLKDYMKWTGDILPEEYVPLFDAFGDMVRIWAIDPARPGIEGFMADVKKRYPNAIFALGHSGATAEDCRKVYRYGVRVQTHHSNSGKAPGRCQGSRGAGCDEFTLYNPDMYAELICDQTGVHVVPDLIKTIVRTKGVEKIILITDHMISPENYPNNEEAGIWYGPDLNYDHKGYLYGSKMTLDNAVRNMMTHTGYGLCHAIRMASLNPARLLGIDDTVGSLEAGKRANLLLIDDMVHVKKVYLDGDLVAEEGKLTF